MMMFANGIQVSGVTYNESANEITFNLSWENSYAVNGPPYINDGAWVFVKYAPNGGDVWYHAQILDSTGVSGYSQYISSDDPGIMIWDASAHQGTFGSQSFTLELAPMLGAYQDFKVFATEMVYLGNGAFYAGDGASPGRFYQGNVNNPWYINSEAAIMRGSGSG
jgi:hypothetical protein